MEFLVPSLLLFVGWHLLGVAVVVAILQIYPRNASVMANEYITWITHPDRRVWMEMGKGIPAIVLLGAWITALFLWETREEE